MTAVPAAGTPDEYQAALLALYPPGAAFPRDPTLLRGRFVGAMADALSRAEGAAVELVVSELDPRTATYMFPDWLTLTAIAEQPTHAETVALIMARLLNLGGQSVGYFIAVAAGLGFTITIVQHTPRRLGRAKMGTPYAGPEWAFVWDVVAPLTTYVPRRYGSSRMGEPYATWGNALLEQIINRLKPAHHFVRFLYQ
jgi:uncharacterized protein YmfQ (DUF2313 family)